MKSERTDCKDWSEWFVTEFCDKKQEKADKQHIKVSAD